MIKKYFDPPWPMQDGRSSVSREELIAHWAGRIIRDNVGDDALYYAEKALIVIPKPNKSARIRSRSRQGWVEVEASGQFFSEVEVFFDKLMEFLNPPVIAEENYDVTSNYLENRR